VERFAEVVRLREGPEVVCVDMPVGLLAHATRGGRDCDKETRNLLGQPRARSVFSPPVREALRYSKYAKASRANRKSSQDKVGISIQSFCLREKLLEVDQVVKPELQNVVREVHPELSFYELNDKRAMEDGKKTPAGFSARRELLLDARFGEVIAQAHDYTRSQVEKNDILDACVACWTAVRILKGDAICLPANPPCDLKGLRMEIWR
jgi:predicted RNase H-like nuclease